MQSKQGIENFIHNTLRYRCCLFKYPHSGGLGIPCLFMLILEKDAGAKRADAAHRHPLSFFTETSHHTAPPDGGSPSLSVCSSHSPPFLYVGRERRVFLFPLLPNPSVQAQLVKFEELKSERSSFQSSECSQWGGTRSSTGLQNKASHRLTGAQLLLLVRLNGEGPNTYSVSPANLQILHVYNPASQVGIQMSARS